MLRKIIKIDPKKCNGCGACAAACHEGAIAMQKGKAVLVKEAYCDGLGDCLPACPTQAISFELREAPAYCPPPGGPAPLPGGPAAPGRLLQWPVQLQLVPVAAPYFNNAHLLLAADCAAYACGSFHNDFMRGRVTLIGCPKLDGADYTQKLAQILSDNTIQSLTVVRMEVPCCGGLAAAAHQALRQSGKRLPLNVVTLSTNGKILE